MSKDVSSVSSTTGVFTITSKNKKNKLQNFIIGKYHYMFAFAAQILLIVIGQRNRSSRVNCVSIELLSHTTLVSFVYTPNSIMADLASKAWFTRTSTAS